LAAAQNLADRHDHTDELAARQRHIFDLPKVLAINGLNSCADQP
jgi:hypothetical protein